MRERKLEWVAHCARRGDKDLTWKRMVREIEDGDGSQYRVCVCVSAVEGRLLYFFDCCIIT